MIQEYSKEPFSVLSSISTSVCLACSKEGRGGGGSHGGENYLPVFDRVSDHTWFNATLCSQISISTLVTYILYILGDLEASSLGRTKPSDKISTKNPF